MDIKNEGAEKIFSCPICKMEFSCGVEMGQHMVNRECTAVVVKEEPSFHSVPVDDVIEISDSSDEEGR